MDSRTAQTIKIMEEKLKEAKSSGDLQTQLVIYKALGAFYDHEKDIRKALENLEEADKIAAKLGRNRARLIILAAIGKIHMDHFKDLDAMAVTQKALNICKEQGYETMKPELIAQIAMIYYMRRDFDNSIANLTTAIQMHRDMGRTAREIDLLQVLERAYRLSGREVEFAGQYGDRLKSVQEKMGIIRKVQQDSLEAARYMNNGDSKRSFEITWRGLKSVETLGDTNAHANLLAGVAIAYDAMNDYRNAVKYMEEAVKVYERIGDFRALPFSHANLGLYYLRLGDAEASKQHVKTALNYCDEMAVQPDEMTNETLKQIFGR